MLLMAGALCGCRSAQPPVHEWLDTDVASAASPQGEVIGVGSAIMISVEQDASLDRYCVVPPMGVIEFPPLGSMAVDGLKPAELEKKIRAGLERDYFQTAEVSVSIARATEAIMVLVKRCSGKGEFLALPAGSTIGDLVRDGDFPAESGKVRLTVTRTLSGLRYRTTFLCLADYPADTSWRAPLENGDLIDLCPVDPPSF